MNIPALAIAVSLALAVPAALSAQERQQDQAQQDQAQQGQQQPPQQAQLSADAHHIIGKTAASQQGKDVGEIKDILVGQDGRVQAMVVDVKGKNRAIPWDQVSMQADQVTVKMNDQQLSQLPEYKGEN
ncbi:MAG: PRC-barrel domain-containing protein [Rhodospirillaceae bacterium]|nr:PRC-barrel domain-containing protein [Rhodospirillales bacterium]